MEELKNKYRELNEALKEKYHDVIYSIADKNGVDVGVGYDMLKANARGGNYESGIEYDKEAFKKEYEELLALSEKILNA